MSEFLYLAYGSNMFTPRLRWRVPSCRPVGRAELLGHRLSFHKRSIDGSAKCDASKSPDAADKLIGVLFAISNSEKRILDKFEGVGHGYGQSDVEVIGKGCELKVASTYFATPDAIDQELVPYTWYLDFVVSGAREHELPESYIDQFISSVRAIPDPDQERDRKKRSEVKFLTD